MRVIRLFFSKTREASYISHLNLQRVMGRALRRSGLPVWYSQGFNPHIYMSFALPLSLGHQSIAEAVDFKTEAEELDFSNYLPALNAALPRGLEAQKVAEAVHSPKEIAAAEYVLKYPVPAPRLQEILNAYAALPHACVLRKTKRSEAEVDLKPATEIVKIPDIARLQCANWFGAEAQTYALCALRLPAGSDNTWNPELFARFLEQQFALPCENLDILRTGILMEDGQAFY